MICDLFSKPTAIFMIRLLMVILQIYVLLIQFVKSVSHAKKRSVVLPSTLLCELILILSTFKKCFKENQANLQFL